MSSTTVPLAVPEALLQAVREAAKASDLPEADVMRQTMKLGLPLFREQCHPLEPFTPEEARRAFAPDPAWEKFESAMSRRPKPVPEAD